MTGRLDRTAVAVDEEAYLSEALAMLRASSLTTWMRWAQVTDRH